MNAKKTFSYIGWCYVVFMILSTFVQAGVNIFLMTTPGLGFTFRWGLEGSYLLLSQVATYVFAFPVFYLMMRRIPAWKKTEPVKMSAFHFLVLLVFCYGMTYVGNFVGSLFMFVGNQLTGLNSGNPLDMALSDVSTGIVAFATVIIAPIMEELLFRKILIDRLIPFGQTVAVVVSGISFGLFHGNFYQFFYAAMLGMIFAYLYTYTGKIRYNIILHMAINFMGGVVSLMLYQGAQEGNIWAIAGVSALGVFVIAAIILSFIIMGIYFDRITWFPPCYVQTKKIAGSILKAPGVIGFIFCCIVMFVLNL